jgi:hypothetical protein
MIFSQMGLAVVRFQGNPHERIHHLDCIGTSGRRCRQLGLPRSRQRQALAEAAAATLEVSTQLQIELSSFKERASRIPELEGLLAANGRP